MLRDGRSSLVRNPLYNPGVEQSSPIPVYVPPVCTVTRSTERPRRGSHSWKAVSTGAGNAYWYPFIAGDFNSTLAVSPDDVIQTSIWVYPVGTPIGISPNIAVYNSSSVLIQNASLAAVCPANTWTYLRNRVVALPGASWATTIPSFVSSGTGVTLYVDDLLITRDYPYTPLPPLSVSNGDDPGWLWSGTVGRSSLGVLR